MKMKRLPLLILLTLCLFLTSLHAQQGLPSAASPTPPIQTGGEVAARAAVEVWLALVDDGQYDKSWDQAAASVKRVVLKDQWVKVFTEHRRLLGKVVSRALQDMKASTTLPGAPEGQYVTVRYNTSFEHKTTAIETVTCTVDDGGQWRVTGYFVR